MASECTQKNSNGHCVKVQRDNQPKKDTHSKKSPSHDQSNGTDIPSEGSSSGASVEAARKSWEDNHIPMRDGTNQTVYGTVPEARKAGDAECYTKVDRRPGHYTIGPLPQGDNANRIPNHVGGRYCVPNDAKTFTSNDPAQPKGPSPEEMLQEVEDQFANTNIQAPVLKQSYNLGTGLSEDNPNVHKGDQINFYVDAPTARWEGDLMIGHVEMESYPTQMTSNTATVMRVASIPWVSRSAGHVAKSHARPQRVTLTSGPVISTRTRPFLTQVVSVWTAATGRLWMSC